MKTSTIIIIAVIVIALSVGGYLLYNKNKNQSSNQNTSVTPASPSGSATATVLGGLANWRKNHADQKAVQSSQNRAQAEQTLQKLQILNDKLSREQDNTKKGVLNARMDSLYKEINSLGFNTISKYGKIELDPKK